MVAGVPVPLPLSASVAFRGQCHVVLSVGGGGLVVALVPAGQGSAIIHRHWGGRRASHAAHSPRHSPKSGLGLRALGPRGSSGDAGGRTTRWTPVMAVISCVPRKA